MPRDIFNRLSNEYGGSFAADSAVITADGLGGSDPSLGLLLQNITYTYQQIVNRIYELGSNKIYYIGGRTQGNLTIAQVIGPKPLAVAFLKKYGDLCNPNNTLTLHFRQSCADDPTAGSPKLSIKFGAVLIIDLRGGVAAQDMLFTHNLGMLFASLEYLE
jgi:hypothetical protein